MRGKTWLKAGIVTGMCAVIILARALHREPFAEGVADPVVETAYPETGDIRLTAGLTGEVEPEQVVYVCAKAGGDVTQVQVSAGDAVQAGQQLCTIDTRQVESAKSSLDSAELALRQAEEELSRQSVLYAGGGISDQAYQQYQDSVESARISYESAKNNYDNQVSYSQVTSPISGVVEMVEAEAYDSVSQGSLLCVISGEGGKTVSFSVSERIRGYLKEGDSITVEKDQQEYEGVISEVSTMADPETGLFQAKAALTGTFGEAELPTGSMVKVFVTSESAENVLTVPVDAVYYEGGLAYVYLYDEASSSLKKQQVETGLDDSSRIEVKSGVSASDQVVTTWSSELYDGAPVRLKETGAGGSGGTEAAEQ